ncbi:MAG: UDP-N-acetylmuramoyl-L-alanine--D-glutamate ligase [Actinobacteria bacterium]|nr:UDP-N-acetylmuramoyl-L-alanine--D-glutamate ligase [Actinomycetota bacterium]MBW3651417.1 UDP-N-acetylmuramoyl-L-alanine--D-glutamate ligase [Actinomycetota bacterium]
MHGLVIGLGVTGEAVTRQLQRRGGTVTVTDDRPGPAVRDRAQELRVPVAGAEEAVALVAEVDVVLPSPGVPFGHPAVQAALRQGVPIWSEFELAARWDSRPVVAVTGTNGKTTVTTLITDMLVESGRKVVAAGNNELPLVDALDLPGVEAFVVEASSFRLQFTESFRPAVGAWLNLSPDHLDWHPSLEHYTAAKARIWTAQGPDDLAVANAEDPVVLEHARKGSAGTVTFGLHEGDFRLVAGELRAPEHGCIARADELPRRLPHDLVNGLAACASVISFGGDPASCSAVLRRFEGLPHRVRLVGDSGGVRWYDDSKATTPASVLAAVNGFDSVVLIAGGRNKGLDLRVLAPLGPRLRGVVAIGEAAQAVADAFAGVAPVSTATSMEEAVERAAFMAEPGDAVILSPGCASYDWYNNYGERGDHFASVVGHHLRARP